MGGSLAEVEGHPRIEVIGVTGIPEVQAGNRLGDLIAAASEGQGTPMADGDVFVVAQKAVSKAEGRVVALASVEPSAFALQIAAPSSRDARLMELVLRESRSIVRMDLPRGIVVVETHHGLVCANAGIDTSNVPGDEVVSLLPEDPDRSARSILDQLGRAAPGLMMAVIVSDTFGRAWREGHANLAIGVAGMESFRDYRGSRDAVGKVLKVTRIALADELASAAELVMGKSDNVPVGIVRGCSFSPGPGGSRALIRDRAKDLFR